MSLFVTKDFVSHSGLNLSFKIECDSLTDEDLDTLAKVAADAIGPISMVYGVPTGGTRFAQAFDRVVKYDPSGDRVIVDDVLTTGKSMVEAKEQLEKIDSAWKDALGVVIFGRGSLGSYPVWVAPIFLYTIPPNDET